MTQFDLIITNGFVVDGTGAAGRNADVGIVGDTIVEVGNLSGKSAGRTIDARGKIVAPGHITQHTHYDAAVFWDPYCLDAGRNGVTTVLNANCGFGIAPVREKDKERLMAMLESTEQIPVEHQRAGLPWDWETFPEYLERVRGLKKGINILTYIPLNPLLIYVMGLEAAKSRGPNKEELAEMHRLINEAMDAGAVGISMSVMGAEGNSHVDTDGSSMPTDALDHQSIIDICQGVIQRGEGIIQMLPQIMHFGDRSITEKVAEAAKGTGVRIIHNTFLTHDLMPHVVDDDLQWLNGLRARGLDVTAGALLNRGWVEAGIRELDAASGQLGAVREIVACNSNEEVLELLAQPDFVQRFVEHYDNADPSNGAAGLEGQIVIEVGEAPELQTYRGKTLKEVAEATGQHTVEALCDLGLKSNLALQLKSGLLTASDVTGMLRLLANPAVIGGGSDGGAHTKAFGMAHYATDYLIWLVREKQVLSLEECHFQTSLKTAKSIRLEDRGALLAGFKADILIYELDKLYFDMERYRIVHDMPNGDWRREATAGGYDYVLVNGEITHQEDQPTGASPGYLARVTSETKLAAE